jgi:MipA family protein
MRVLFMLGSTLIAVASPALSQERAVNFALRGGVGVAPDYPGSNNYSAAPDAGFSFGALRWRRIEFGSAIGVVPDNGLALRGAFEVLGSRDAAGNPELSGLKDIDTAVELGLGVVYQETDWRVFGEVRQGLVGHKGVSGTIGADLILRPDRDWTITAGPRVHLGNSEYASTYFGVSSSEAAVSAFSAFGPDGGVLGIGFEVGVTYRIDERWAIVTVVGYEKLINDAADSPITAIGAEDQWTLRVGLSRAFTLRF